MDAPIFIPPNISHWFEKCIVNVLKYPQHWSKELCPFKRVFLISGQKGTQVDGILYSLLLQHKITSFDYFKVHAHEDVASLFEEKNDYKDVLIINNVDKLLYHQHIGINYLKKLKYLFIICCTHDFYNDQILFWKQFKFKLSIKLPSLEFYTLLLRHYFSEWAKHWKTSKVLLNDENYDTLAKYCAYCTSKDVAKFAQNVFSKIIYDYPEENTDITMSYLENKDNMLLFTPFSEDDYTYCIVNEDKSRIQKRFDPVQNDLEFNNLTRKRLRSSPTRSTGNGIDGNGN